MRRASHVLRQPQRPPPGLRRCAEVDHEHRARRREPRLAVALEHAGARRDPRACAAGSGAAAVDRRALDEGRVGSLVAGQLQGAWRAHCLAAIDPAPVAATGLESPGSVGRTACGPAEGLRVHQRHRRQPRPSACRCGAQHGMPLRDRAARASQRRARGPDRRAGRRDRAHHRQLRRVGPGGRTPGRGQGLAGRVGHVIRRLRRNPARRDAGLRDHRR